MGLVGHRFATKVTASCCCILLFGSCAIIISPSEGFSLPVITRTRRTTTIRGRSSPSALRLSDYSKDAISLFNNMRTPAALLSGGLVPLGIITAPEVTDSDTKFVKLLKKANMLLAVASLLSELMAVMYSSIAINKLVEIPSPRTSGVSDLISKNFEVAWLGTNFHFLFGMIGFGLLVGNRVYLAFGNPVGKLALGMSASFFLKALSIINTGIAMGASNVGPENACRVNTSVRFASNFSGLALKYLRGIFQNCATGGICSIASVVIAAVTAIQTIKMLMSEVTAEDAKAEGSS